MDLGQQQVRGEAQSVLMTTDPARLLLSSHEQQQDTLVAGLGAHSSHTNSDTQSTRVELLYSMSRTSVTSVSWETCFLNENLLSSWRKWFREWS